MAIYIPGKQSYFPNWQPFVPDYKFLSNVLDARTNKYNTNYNRLNDLYSKIVYADLSRNDTKSKRDQYTNGLSKQLEKISGLDFSLEENVFEAKQLFTPFFEDNLIVSDMLHTKDYKKNIEYANSLLNSTDPEKRKLYWNEGVQYLNYKMEDFINADSDKAIKMPMAKYVPNPNLYEKALDILNKSGLQKIMEFPSGNFIVEQKNGNLITTPAYEMVRNVLLDDASIIQAYSIDAYVKARNYAQKGLEEGKFKSLDEGKRQWAIDKVQEINLKLAESNVKDEIEIKELERELNLFKKESKKGVVPGSEFERMLNDKELRLEAIKTHLEKRREAMANNNILEQESNESALNKASNLLINSNLNNDLYNAALSYSNKDTYTKLKVDEFKLKEFGARLDHGFKMQEMQAQYKYNLALKEQEYLYDLNLEKFKAENDLKSKLENNLNQLFSSGFYAEPTTKTISVDEINTEVINTGVDLRNNLVDLTLQLAEEINGDDLIYNLPQLKFSGNITDLKSKLNNLSIKKLAPIYNYYKDSFEDIKSKNPKNLNENTISRLTSEMFNLDGKINSYNRMYDDVNKNYFYNFNLALKTNNGKKIKQALDRGIPSIFVADGSRMKSFEEFKAEYEKKLGKQIFDSSPVVEFDEKNRSLLTDFEKTFTPEKTITGKPMPKSSSKYAITSSLTNQLKNAYNAQKELINFTLNFQQEATAEEKTTVSPYRYVNPKIMMEGLIPTNDGSLLYNPVYETYINPDNISDDFFSLIKQLQNQVTFTNDKNETLNSDDAKAILNQYFIRLQSEDKNAGMQLQYLPEFNLNGKKAGYKIIFDNEFTKDNPIKSIVVSFPQDQDINPKRNNPNLNYSTVVSEVNYNSVYTKEIPNGGKISVQKNSSGDYILYTTPYEYKNGIFEDRFKNKINLSDLLRNKNENQNMIDTYVLQAIKILENNAINQEQKENTNRQQYAR